MKTPQNIVLLLIWGVFIPFSLYSQKDTTLNYKAVTIKGHHLKIEQHQQLNRKEIDALSPTDLGDLLQHITGLTIKNYGGIGSMKTLSYRGMGGSHTQLIIDSQPISDPQNGQINFATLPVNTAESIQLLHPGSTTLLPVSSLVKGSSILLNTFHQSFSLHPFSLRSTLTLGSFGQKEGYLAVKKGGKKNFVSLTGSYRTYDGNYPYHLPIGQTDTTFRRRNNSMTDFSIGLGTGFRWKTKKTRQQLKLEGTLYNIRQELPGAVVLYNNLAGATMTTKRIRSGITYKLLSKTFGLRAFVNYTNHYLHYHDPHYLNAQGYIDNLYITNTYSGGVHARYSWKGFDFHLGTDVAYDQMSTSRLLGYPQRITSTSMAKIRYNHRYFYVEGSIFHQLFNDNNDILSHHSSYQKFHPQIGIYTSDALLKNFQFYVWYKPSSRAPSFNELYYSQIGNLSLVPEEANQINAGVHFIHESKHVILSATGNVFKNNVLHKIVAIPTKNLFVWSVQNIGKVDIFGGDVYFNLTLPFARYWKIEVSAGASYQKAVDISDASSPTYNDQIAYTPKLTGNFMAGIRYKTIGFHLSGLYTGERYSLNENIPANYLPSYFVLDITGSYVLKLKKKHELKLYLGVKNVTNVSYNFVRYFIAPPRNFYLKLSYAFH